ncbi:MAG: hypothetical protein JKY88_10485 [Pseudomonadales bacterium]|nr:hypothetical protein [Pseudomonadales bacterium]
MLEETNITSDLESLVGVYSSSHSVRFLFQARIPKNSPAAGHEIQKVAIFTLAEVMLWSDDTLVAPKNLRLMLKDVKEGKNYSIEQMVDNR